jgi:hypothetical protein
VRELHAFFREAVDVRRIDVRAVVAEIGLAEVVCENHDQVRSAFGSGSERGEESGAE